jgi:hypothetical protein
MYRQWSTRPSAGENIFAASIRLLKIDLHTDFVAWRKLPQQYDF